MADKEISNEEVEKVCKRKMNLRYQRKRKEDFRGHTN